MFICTLVFDTPYLEKYNSHKGKTLFSMKKGQKMSNYTKMDWSDWIKAFKFEYNKLDGNWVELNIREVRKRYNACLTPVEAAQFLYERFGASTQEDYLEEIKDENHAPFGDYLSRFLERHGSPVDPEKLEERSVLFFDSFFRSGFSNILINPAFALQAWNTWNRIADNHLYRGAGTAYSLISMVMKGKGEDDREKLAYRMKSGKQVVDDSAKWQKRWEDPETHSIFGGQSKHSHSYPIQLWFVAEYFAKEVGHGLSKELWKIMTNPDYVVFMKWFIHCLIWQMTVVVHMAKQSNKNAGWVQEEIQEIIHKYPEYIGSIDYALSSAYLCGISVEVSDTLLFSMIEKYAGDISELHYTNHHLGKYENKKGEI